MKLHLVESDKPAAQSIEDCQKWVDYDMEHYGKISANTNKIVKKAGFQIQKNDHGDYEVTAGKFEDINEKYDGPYGKQQIGWMKNQAEDYDDIEYSQYPNYDKRVTVIGGQRVPVYIYPTAEDCGHSVYYAFKTTDGGWKNHMPYIYNLKKYADAGDFEIASDWKLLDKYPYLEYIGKKESMKESTDTIRIKGIDVKVYPGTWEDFEKEKDFDKFVFDKIYTVDGKKYKVMHNYEDTYEYAFPLTDIIAKGESMKEAMDFKKITLKDSDYIINDRNGTIITDKETLEFSDNDKYYYIKFIDDNDDTEQVYKVVDTTKNFVELEYVSEKEEFVESMKEDTVKQNGKWVNKGKEGTHGKFTTKKAADAQRRAMFANGYKAESKMNEAEEEAKQYYGVFETGGSIGQNDARRNDLKKWNRSQLGSLFAVYDSKEKAQERAKRRRSIMSRSYAQYYGVHIFVAPLSAADMEHEQVKKLISEKNESVKKSTRPVTESLNKKVEEQVKEEFDDTVSTYFSHYLN